VNEALAALARALARRDAAAVLDAEVPLADALRAFPKSTLEIDAADRAAVRALVADARRLLRQCRQLGDVARDLVAAALPSAQGYGRTGARLPSQGPMTFHSRS